MSELASDLFPGMQPSAAALQLIADARGFDAAHELVASIVGRRDLRVVFTTGFGMEGCVLVDMLSRSLGARGGTADVHYLDTHFLFEETHALRDRLARRYANIRFLNSGTALTPEEQAQIHGPELWRRNPERCCALRKVVPMTKLLDGADAWVTAIRRSQSETRASVSTADWDSGFGVVKLSPLAAWSREEVWAYVQAHEVPYNELHDKGYPSIGCTHCTTAVDGASASGYSREGRWPGTPKTECGLHAAPELHGNDSTIQTEARR
jgi:phosphoadenosine phosphosulfate reductase